MSKLSLLHKSCYLSIECGIFYQIGQVIHCTFGVLSVNVEVMSSADESTDGKPACSPVGVNLDVIAADVQKVLIPAPVRPDVDSTTMLKAHFDIAAPSVFAMLFMFLSQTVQLAFVGQRMGAGALAGFSVGLSVFNILGASTSIGLLCALDTLAPQAYGRNSRTSELTLLLQRALGVNAAILLGPLLLIFYTCEPLLALVYGPDVAPGAAEMLRAMPLYMIPLWTTIAIAKLMRAQQLAGMPSLTNALGTGCCFVVNYYWLPEGSSITRATCNLAFVQLCACVAIIIMAKVHPRSLVFEGRLFTKEVFEKHGVAEFIQVGSASVIGMCSEWWALEVSTIAAARIGSTEVASFAILLNILLVFESFAWCSSMAGSSLIGNALGADQPEVAKRYSRLTLKVCGVLMCCTASVLLFQGKTILSVYTSSEAIHGVLFPILPLIALWHLIDAGQASLNGMYRGAGKPDEAARYLLGTMWLVGVPMAWLLSLWARWGLAGILMGQSLGQGLLIPLYARGMLTWDWDALAVKASRRMAKALQVADDVRLQEDARHPDLDLLLEDVVVFHLEL